MSDTDDTADAALRLENALERIAMLAARRQELQTPSGESANAPDAYDPDAPDMAMVTTRLDTIIAQIRGALR
jgi:hypothetical protein